MRSRNRTFALFALLGWLFACGHVTLQHGGDVDCCVHHSLAGEVDDDDHAGDAPGHDGGHHHHDLTALDARQWVKSADHEPLAPVWLPICDALVQRLTALLRAVHDLRTVLPLEHSPPDARASGWLLVCHSALPVRGPSLAV